MGAAQALRRVIGREGRHGEAQLRGAGGEVVRFDDHKPLTYGKPGFDNPFFIAFAPGVLLVRD